MAAMADGRGERRYLKKGVRARKRHWGAESPGVPKALKRWCKDRGFYNKKQEGVMCIGKFRERR